MMYDIPLDTNLDVLDINTDIISNEHDVSHLQSGVCSVAPHYLAGHFSASVAFYFHFAKWNVFLYAAAAVASLGVILPQLLRLDFPTCETSWSAFLMCMQQTFFISNTPKSAFFFWLVSFLCLVAFYLGFIFLYFATHKQRCQNTKQHDYGSDTYDQPQNIHCSNHTHMFAATSTTLPAFLSGVIFFLLLGTYALVQAILQRWLSLSHEIPLMVLGGMVHVLFKTCWRLGCWLLSMLERYPTVTPFYRSYFFKIYLFDGLTFIIFYVSHRFLSQAENQCETDWIAKQYVTVLVLDYVWIGLSELVIIQLQNCLAAKCGADMIPFYAMDLPEEYTRLLMRQYLTVSGYFLVYGLPWLSLLFSFLDYWRTLYKLIRLSKKKPGRSPTDFNHILLFAMCCNLCFSLLGYPGWLWYSVYSVSMNKNCGQGNLLSIL